MNTSNVNVSNKFLPVKDAATYLQLKVGQIKHLIAQNLIDYKLDNGTSVVDVNSIDKLVIIDLKKRENVYPIGKNYKLKSNKEIVINSIIDGVENLEEKYFVEYKKWFERLCGNNGINHDVSKIQLWVIDMICLYHNNKNPMFFDYEEYTIVYLNNKNETKYYFYVVDTKELFFMRSFYNFSVKKINEYIYENNLFYLTLDEFIKEFSPTKHYEKNKIWSMYLDQTEYVAEEAANDEEIKELYMVNGFTRNQPYGSRQNPQYKKIWIDPFERGRQKVKKAA